MRQRISPKHSCDIGSRIRELRRERGFSQEALAELCNLSTSLIGHIERGEKLPSLGTVMTMSRVLNISLDWLVWGRADVVCDRERCPLYSDLVQLISRYEHL